MTFQRRLEPLFFEITEDEVVAELGERRRSREEFEWVEKEVQQELQQKKRQQKAVRIFIAIKKERNKLISLRYVPLK